MTKKILGLVGSVVLASNLFASDKILSQKKISTLLKQEPFYHLIKRKLNNKIITAKGVEKKDFWILTLKDIHNSRPTNIYITKDLKYTFLGGVLVENKTNKTIKANYPINTKIIKDGVVLTYGTGKENLYIVTDPECPFCKRFEKMAEKANLSKKYKINVIFLPLSFHKHSISMIYYILSASTDEEKAKRFQEVLLGSNNWENHNISKKEIDKINKIIVKSKKAASELGVRGTPSFFDKDFKEIKNRNSILKGQSNAKN